MPTRAEWRVRRGEPRSLLHWVARDLVAPLRLVALRIGWSVRTLALVAVCHGDVGFAVIAVMLSFLPETLVDGAVKSLDSRHRFGPFGLALRSLPVGEILALPPPSTPFPCQIEVSQCDTLVGSDVGIVTFIDGRLGFEGRRTSFSLRRTDVDGRLDDTLSMPDGGRVAFVPQDWLVAEGVDEIDLRHRFRANLESWMRSDAPEGESVLPPLASHPTGIARAWGNLAVCGLVGWLLFSNAPVASKGLLLAWPFVLGALQAARDLWRLESLASFPTALEERT